MLKYDSEFYKFEFIAMVVIATVSRTKSFLYAILILLIINLVVLAFIYFHYLSNSDRGEVPPIVNERGSLETVKPHIPSTVQPVGPKTGRSFLIDYEHDTFLKDGKPFKYIAGSLHYFRVPRIYWRDRLRKYRAAGLNAVTTYVEWATHEPSPGEYRFTGEEDIEYFVQLAQQEDLLVILRPGPYVCAERDFGGFPPWLMTLHPKINLRTDDNDYQTEVKKWFDVLFKRINQYLYGLGGPIIMVQVENEYGSFPACNTQHKIWLRDLMKWHVKENAVLFTTDGSSDFFLKCGAIPGVYATVDFGTTASVEDSFNAMRMYSSKGPLVNSEFYPGWLSHWEEKMERVDTSAILKMMTDMFARNASFNFYMFFGGTNFGFMNGANFDDKYKPQLTSYDYDAPLDEAGDPTPKYYAIRDLIGKYVPLPKLPLPTPAPRGHYGTVTLKPVVSLFNHTLIPDTKTTVAQKPATFESLNLKYGYVLYETKIPENVADPSVLDVYNLRDRAIVYVNEISVAILSRSRNIYSTPLMAIPGSKLSLLVENQGRINYGSYLKDEKGLTEIPLMNNEPLFSWTMTTFPFGDVKWVPTVASSLIKHDSKHIEPPAVYYGELVLSPHSVPQNTFIDPSGWGKGIIFVNNHNVGRYWPSVGSQVTLFVPGCYLLPAPEKNHIVLVETEYPHPELKIIFTDKPFLNKTPPKIGIL